MKLLRALTRPLKRFGLERCVSLLCLLAVSACYLGMQPGGFRAEKGAGEAGFAGDAAAAHDEDMGGGFADGAGHFGEALVGLPGQVGELQGHGQQDQKSESGQRGADGAEEQPANGFHGRKR